MTNIGKIGSEMPKPWILVEPGLSYAKASRYRIAIWRKDKVYSSGTNEKAKKNNFSMLRRNNTGIAETISSDLSNRNTMPQPWITVEHGFFYAKSENSKGGVVWIENEVLFLGEEQYKALQLLHDYANRYVRLEHLSRTLEKSEKTTRFTVEKLREKISRRKNRIVGDNGGFTMLTAVNERDPAIQWNEAKGLKYARYPGEGGVGIVIKNGKTVHLKDIEYAIFLEMIKDDGFTLPSLGALSKALSVPKSTIEWNVKSVKLKLSEVMNEDV